MDGNSCFVCGTDCSDSTLVLINLETKKYKTRYTVLIGNLINSEYELRIAKSDKICEKCSVLIEKYDELQYETKTVKSVLSRQIAITYSIETDEELMYMDKSKIFAELRANGNDQSTKYSCKLCPNFVTTCIDTVNAHIMYHKIMDEQKTSLNSVIKESKTPSTSKPRAQQSAREVQKLPVKSKSTSNEAINHVGHEQLQIVKQQVPVQYQINNVQEYEEESLDSLIDLNLLDDEYYDSNLTDHKCAYEGCPETFVYASDYVRHLRLKHKATLNYIFSALKSNLKRPKKLSSLMCPYCFTKMSSNEQLESHVKQHEEAAQKTTTISDRISEFVASLMQACRCTVCDCEILDPTTIECNHEIVKNGMAPKLNCMSCDQYFYSERLYNCHLAMDHSQCFCCGSYFKDRTILKGHIRSHLGHSEYACDFCKDIYQTKKNRLDHIKSKHATQCCSFCDEWYKDIDELEHHVRFAHADKRSAEQKASICDNCGATFKAKHLYEQHLQQDHKTRKIYKCSSCKTDFRYRYLLMDHVASDHNRTIVDNEVSFYKCCYCRKGFSSQNRKAFVEHLEIHQSSSSYCYDCNANQDSPAALQAHREKIHQDFSKTVDGSNVAEIPKVQGTTRQNNNKTTHKLASQDVKITGNNTESVQQLRKNSTAKPKTTADVVPTQVQQVAAQSKYEIIDNVHLDPQQQQQPQTQQIMIQNEDGTFLNMNNLILTDNGELIIQNLDGLLPNGQEADEGTQIQIGNLEQFLIEQGLSSNAEISYIQQDMIGDGQVIIQNEDGTTQDSALMQTYKEIFEPDDEIAADLTADAQQIDTQSQSILMNGDFVLQTPNVQQQIVKPVTNNNNILQASIEHVDVGNSQAVDAANQSTLDELGDILLEVAAAAEKEKKPKSTDQNQRAIRENLWGKKRQLETMRENNAKRRSTKQIEVVPEAETPAQNFSQAYELFVRGFDAKKQKQL